MTPSNLLRTALGAASRGSAALRLFTLAIAASAITACGGGGGGDASPAPAANSDPQASFAAPASGGAGQALAFDASASGDADGDPLTFSWDFGDGSHGGGAQLAHVFPSGGSFTVTLTVADGRGGSASATRNITVSASPPLSAAAPSVASVSDAAGALAGVEVTVLETQASATTGGDGKANIAIATGAPVTLKFSKGGYADQFKSVRLQSGASGLQVAVRMLAREDALTLADAAAGGTLAGKQGATLVVPAGALVDGAGNAVSGAVQVAITPVDVAADVRDFPGLFQGLRASGARGLIESYGTVEYVLTKNGAPLQVAPGQNVTIEIPIYTGLHRDGSAVAAGQVIPLWSLDERTAAWVQEGTGTVVASAASPSGFALRAHVSHLSWWNCDQWLGSIPDGSYNPKIKCCIREVPNGPCKENSGDICEHTGSGPSSSGVSGNRARDALQRALRERPAQGAGAPRVPAVAAFATAPAVAGAVLPMPADMDITLTSSARNGTYRGTTVLRGGAGVGEDVTVSLLPVAGGGNDESITLPWAQNYGMQSIGEVDRYKLTMPAGPGFEVTASRAGSTLGGTLKVTRPDGSVIASSNFGSNSAYVAETTVSAAGTYTIEVSASGGVPGAYKLEAASFGNCSSVDPLTLPITDQLFNFAPNQSRCFDIALAADEVFHLSQLRTHNQLAGSVSLSTAGGAQQLASAAYPGSRPLLVGIPATGTYRLRLTNTSLNNGKLELTIGKPAAQVLTVPGSVTLTSMGPGAPVQYFVLKPPGNGLYQVGLAVADGLQAGVQVEPAGLSFVSGCSGCGGGAQNTSSDARAVRHSGFGLPVAVLFRNDGNGDTVTLSTGVPTLIQRDTDIDGLGGNGLRVYALDANAGDVVAYRLAQPEGTADLAPLRLSSPSGNTVSSSGAVTLPETGVYSAVVGKTLGGAFGVHTLRINTAPPVQPLPLAAPTTVVPFDLPLGQVLRYSVDLTQGELVGLSLATPGSLHLLATLDNPVVEGHVSTASSGNGPFDVASPPAFVRGSGSVLLTVRGNSIVLERARGNGNTLRVHKPAPVNAALNVTQTGNLAVGGWTSHRFTVPTDGYYLLHLASSAPAPYSIAATVWASGSSFSNYGGEFKSSVASNQLPDENLGRLPAGSYTVTVRNTHGSAAASYAMGLVDLEPPQAIAINGAPLAGTVDAAGERDFASFDATAGQAFTLRTTAVFAGTVRVRKLVVPDQWAGRNWPQTIPGMPVALSAGVESVFSFTIPNDLSFGSGTYVVEVAPDGAATGGHTMQLSSP